MSPKKCNAITLKSSHFCFQSCRFYTRPLQWQSSKYSRYSKFQIIAKLRFIVMTNMFDVILTLSRPVPQSVIWVCLQPLPPVRPHTAGLYCFPFFTNTCSIPTWCPASLWRKDRHRLPSFQGGVSGRTSRAPRPVLLFPTSGMVRYRPPVETNSSSQFSDELSVLYIHTVELTEKRQGDIRGTSRRTLGGIDLFLPWWLQ